MFMDVSPKNGIHIFQFSQSMSMKLEIYIYIVWDCYRFEKRSNTMGYGFDFLLFNWR
jgi:hypothetical protein